MFTFSPNRESEKLDGEIIGIMGSFASSNSTLALAIKEESNVKSLIESEMIYSSDQYRYGKVPHIHEAKHHWTKVRQDLHYFSTVCHISPHIDFVEACFFWRLKTGKSLAELSEDILTLNLEYHDGSWFSDSPQTVQNKGKLFSVLGLPAFGKSRFSEQLQELGDFRLLDPDTFRFYTMAKDVLVIDGDLFERSYEGKIKMSQHLYGPTMRNVHRLLFLSTALVLNIKGHDIIANGFVLADEEESDKLFWIESEELPLTKFLEMKFPSLDAILRLQDTSKDSEDFLRRIESQDLKDVIEIISTKVDRRVEMSQGELGDFDWLNPTKELLLEFQKAGANPRMNVVDIALKIVGIHETIKQLEEHGQKAARIDADSIPSVDRIRYLLGSSGHRLLFVTSPSDTRLPGIPKDLIATPGELYSARMEAIYDSEKPISRIPQLIQEEIDKLDSEFNDGRYKLVAEIAFQKTMQVLNGIISGASPNTVHRQVLSGLPTSRKKELMALIGNILTYGLTATREDNGTWRYHFRGRWEPALNRFIPAPLHSIMIMPYLGISMTGEEYDVYRCVADTIHDLLEEAIYHKEENHILQSGKLYSRTQQARANLLNAIHNLNGLGPYAAFCAAIFGDTYTDKEEKLLYQIAVPEIERKYKGNFIKALNGVDLGESHSRYTILDGPVRDCLLSIQLSTAFARMNERLNDGDDEDLDREIIGAISSKRRDLVESVLTIDRYLDPGFVTLTPTQARAKIIAYTGRLIASHTQLMETYLSLPEEIQIELSPSIRTFIPCLDWAINELVNPKLIKLEEKPISKEEIYRFYWDFYLGYTKALKPLLQPFAETRVDDAFNRRGW